MPIEAHQPPVEIIDQARRLVEGGRRGHRGTEYVIDARDGRHNSYDLHALSNFVADALRVIGFNPYVDLAELIIERAGPPLATGSVA